MLRRPMLRRMSHLIRRGWRHPGWINRLLYPLSLGYAGLMSVRRRAYARGLFKRHKLPVPLVVVGNLSVGGVGKTPLVIELVAGFKSRGMNPGVISRGYHGRSRRWPREVLAGVDAGEVGDEPVLIFRRCRVPVMAGANRLRSARLLLARHGCDIIISDDGFQHLALARDLDIVVIDGEQPFGNGWCLPAGPLREPPAALARADIIVVNGKPGQEARQGARQEQYAMTVAVDRAVRLDGAQTRPLSAFAGQTVHGVAGIGNPGRFFRQLAAHGLRVVPHEYPDHHRFTPADFGFADDSAVLMTEKDAVKCEALGLPPATADRCWTVPLGVTLAPDLLPAVIKICRDKICRDRLPSCPGSTS